MAGRRSLGPFVLERSLGRDALSELHLARSTRMEAPIVELRVFKTTTLAVELLRARPMSASLQHPNVVVVFERGVIEGRAYVASEHVLGHNLIAIRDRLRTDRAQLPVSMLTRLLADGLTALAHLEELEVRAPIAPSSFFLTYGGVGKLADVDLPLELAADRAHLAPEVRSGGAATARSELYGLAASIDYLIAGGPPLAPSLSALLASMLSADPAARPQSARDALKDLLTATEHAPATRLIAGRWLSDLFPVERAVELAKLETIAFPPNETTDEASFGDEESTFGESEGAEGEASFLPESTLAVDAKTERAPAPRSARKSTVVLTEEDTTHPPRGPRPTMPSPTYPSPPRVTPNSPTAETPIPAGITPRVAERFGAYRIYEQVGEGGMAEVHRAVRADDPEEKPCVIKRLDRQFRHDPEYLGMFAEEARIASLLKHPNIVRCVEAGEIDDIPFIALELIEGLDLAALLTQLQPGRLPPSAALQIALQVARALDYAHRVQDERGRSLELVHRDVSPENILIAWTGEVKLLDFGLSKFEGRGFQTRAGVIKGKLSYMAPEQLDLRRVDARTDLYQLGVVLAEALAGKKLFGPEVLLGRPKDQVALRNLLEQHLAAAGALPEPLIDLLTRLCAFDAQQRPQSAREVAQELEAIAAKLQQAEGLESIIASRAPAVARSGEATQRTAKRGPMSAVLLALVLMSVAAGVAWFVATQLDH